MHNFFYFYKRLGNKKRNNIVRNSQHMIRFIAKIFQKSDFRKKRLFFEMLKFFDNFGKVFRISRKPRFFALK